jgi:hypothetical protein
MSNFNNIFEEEKKEWRYHFLIKKIKI